MRFMEIVRITSFETSQFEAARRLVGQLSVSLPPLTETVYRDFLGSPDSHLFMAIADGVPVGMLTVCIYRTLGGLKAWIEDVVVDAVYRGFGYGRLLVEHGIAYARSMAVDTLMLTSNPSRTAANTLYRSLGFDPYVTNVYKMKFH